ncbi:NAD(P)-dependent oxidoreductase [Planctomycetota bacterium]|nr:NAD(P)-dependent oxidoreductase [Planctomycetota bacterium]
MAHPVIAVTGATGTTGGATARALIAQGYRPRLLVRDPAKAEAAFAGAADCVAAESGDLASVRSALAGVDRLFVVAPPKPGDILRFEATLVQAAREAGVRRLVKLSAFGAGPQSITYGRIHYAAEGITKAANLEWTVLQPNFFMQNCLGSAGDIKVGTFHQPWADAGASVIDAVDIGAVAAAALVRDDLIGRTLVLTGPEAVTGNGHTAALSAALGKTITYVPLSPERFAGMLSQWGMEPYQATGVSELMDIWRKGWAAKVSPTVEEILGRPPRSFADFVRDHLAAFR